MIGDVEWLARKLRDVGQRLAALEGIAHSHRFEEVTTGAVAVGNWTVVSLAAQTSRSLCSFVVVVQRTTAILATTDGTGNVLNESVATLPTSCRGALTLAQPLSSASTGRGAHGAYTPSTGTVTLAAVAGPDDIAIGDQLSLGGVVLLNP